MEPALARQGRERKEEGQGPWRKGGGEIAQERRVNPEQYAEGDRPKAGQTPQAPDLPFRSTALMEGLNEKRHLMPLDFDGGKALRHWD